MRAIAAALTVATLVLCACSPATPSPAPSPATQPRPPGVAGDEPCSLRIAADQVPASIGYHVEDLERLVLRRTDLGGLAGFETDPLGYGYQGNGELETIEVHPDGTCDAMARFGRVTGFSETVERSQGDVTERISTTAHLFWD